MARGVFTLGDLCPRWDGVAPGTRVPCHSPLIGREVTLRKGESPALILGCTAPIPLTTRKREKLSKRRRCEGGFEVRFPQGLAIPFAVSGSKVRERLRVREGLCPDALALDPHSGFVSYVEREAHRNKRNPFDEGGGELPFPHRLGSTPCCVNSPVYPDKVSAALAELATGEGFFEAGDVMAMARRMVPKSLRASVRVESLEDVPQAVEAVKNHCWDVVRHWESKRERAAVSSSARESAVSRRLAKQASDEGASRSASVGVGGSRRRVEVGWTDIEDMAKKGARKRAAVSYFRPG